MDISFIIPALNEEKLIGNLLIQLNEIEAFKLFTSEIILSDGGSTDKTIDLASRYNAKVIVHSKNEKQTIANARNLGASIASGKILVFVNADIRFADVLKFANMLTMTLQVESFSAATFTVLTFPESRKASDYVFHTAFNSTFKLMNLLGVGMGRGECQVVSKSVFKSIGGYNDFLIAGEDFDLYKRIRKHFTVKFINDIVIYESPRRYRKFGYLKISFEWFKNSISIIFRHKSVSKLWEQVR